MKRISVERKCWFLAAMVMLWAQNSQGAQGDVGFSARAGTLGGGIEVGIGLSETLVFRGGVNYLKFDFDTTISDVDYTMEPEFKNGSLLLDWHPFGGVFRLTGGVLINGNEVSVDGVYRKDLIPAAYQDYAHLADLAHIRGTVDFNTFAPYVGFGWSSGGGEPGWGISLDLGVMFQGAPQVSELSVDAPATVATHPETQRFLEEQKQAIEDELDKFQYYPVATITLNYIF